MKKIFFSFAIILGAYLIPTLVFDSSIHAQGLGNQQFEDYPLNHADRMPEFPGGEVAMINFLSKNIVYPPLAKENGVEGKVILRFVVNKKGMIEQISQVNNKIGWGIDDEAIRVVKSMPKWKAAKNKGKTVNCFLTLPIVFKIK